MKAFIVAAMLVACVAGQSTMDILKLNKEYNYDNVNSLVSKFDRPLVNNRNFHWMDKVFRGDYDYTNTVVYDINEIVSHPLFREYMQLPLFQQYWQYHHFQKYVCSVFFQRFWTIPTFQEYFVNPTLFYQYILPIVNLFKYDVTSRNVFTPYGYNFDKYYYGQEERDLVHHQRHIPEVCRYDTVVCEALLEKFYNHFVQYCRYYGQEDQEINNTGYNFNRYNPYVARMIQGYYGKYYPTVNTIETVEDRYPYNYFNKNFDYNTIDEVATPYYYGGYRYNHVRPQTYFGKTFDKKFENIYA